MIGNDERELAKRQTSSLRLPLFSSSFEHQSWRDWNDCWLGLQSYTTQLQMEGTFWLTTSESFSTDWNFAGGSLAEWEGFAKERWQGIGRSRIVAVSASMHKTMTCWSARDWAKFCSERSENIRTMVVDGGITQGDQKKANHALASGSAVGQAWWLQHDVGKPTWLAWGGKKRGNWVLGVRIACETCDSHQKNPNQGTLEHCLVWCCSGCLVLGAGIWCFIEFGSLSSNKVFVDVCSTCWFVSSLPPAFMWPLCKAEDGASGRLVTLNLSSLSSTVLLCIFSRAQGVARVSPSEDLLAMGKSNVSWGQASHGNLSPQEASRQSPSNSPKSLLDHLSQQNVSNKASCPSLYPLRLRALSLQFLVFVLLSPPHISEHDHGNANLRGKCKSINKRLRNNKDHKNTNITNRIDMTHTTKCLFPLWGPG